MSPANVPSQDNLVSADSGKKSLAAEEIEPSSQRTETAAEEQTANAEPEELFRPSSEGKGISLGQTEDMCCSNLCLCISLLQFWH